jgi:hypothetical protein
VSPLQRESFLLVQEAFFYYPEFSSLGSYPPVADTRSSPASWSGRLCTRYATKKASSISFKTLSVWKWLVWVLNEEALNAFKNTFFIFDKV